MINIIQNTIGALGRVLGIVRKNLQLWLDFERSDWVGGELVAKDKSPNTNNAKLFTGKALSFNGNDAVTDFGNPNVNLKSICFWVNLDTTTEQLFNLTATHSIEAVSGVITLNGTWSNSNIYVDGIATTSIGTTPQRVVVTTDTSILVSDLEFARIGTDYGSLDLADVQMYDAEFTLADALLDYNNPNHLIFDVGGSIALADLKGYWAMSEGDGLVAYDSSGEGNNGTINGATYTPAQDTIPQLGMMDWANGSNLLEYSQDFSQWALVNSTILSENTTSPDGTVNAYRITSTSNGDSAFVRNTSATQIVSTTYSYSCFVKKGTTNYVRLANRAIGTASESSAWFDIENGVVGTLGSSLTSSNIESYGNGWYRCTLIGSTGSSIPNQLNDIAAATSDGLNPAQLGDYIYYWGAQIEESSSVGNYILTGGAAAIDVTTIQNPTNKGYDILGNALRLRERGFNLGGSGYGEITYDASLNISNGTLQFWLKTSDTKFNILSGQSTSEFIGTTDNSVWSFGNAGTITSYIGAATANTQPLYDGNWSFYTFTGIDLSTWTAFEISNLAGFELDGLLDEVILYSSVLTTKEIKNNYNIGINKHKATSSFSDDFSSDYGI